MASSGVFSVPGLVFSCDFDSGNLREVMEMSVSEEDKSDAVDRSFDLWTRPDCFGTDFENGNRTWFLFSIHHNNDDFKESERQGQRAQRVLLNVRNLNKQSKLFSQGMAPLQTYVSQAKNNVRPPPTCPAPHQRSKWERITERLQYSLVDSQFNVSFVVKTEPKSVLYVAFTYPYSYLELQGHLNKLERKYSSKKTSFEELQQLDPDTIYFHRELLAHSYEQRRVDLITVTSLHGIQRERAVNFDPNFNVSSEGENVRRHRFQGKKIVFVSARVHPGETQSSFVINGMMNMLLRDKDPRSIALRKRFVFLFVPMLNPDGVVRGHYRTDCRGVNLNRIYTSPDARLHPQIFAVRRLILEAHQMEVANNEVESNTTQLPVSSTFFNDDSVRNVILSPSESRESMGGNIEPPYVMTETSRFSEGDESIADFSMVNMSSTGRRSNFPSFSGAFSSKTAGDSSSSSRASDPGLETKLELMSEDANLDFPAQIEKGDEAKLFLYLDVHGHASKRGIFMYGNHFADLQRKVDAMLLPKLCSINCANFDFPACNFTEKNMYLKDRHTGAGREGSGRVSVFTATSLTYCYTMECNFNTGRVVNSLASVPGRFSPPPNYAAPPKYDPGVYEEAGRAIAVSILDLVEANPCSRLAVSSWKGLKGVKDWLRKYIKQQENSAENQAKSSSSTNNATSTVNSRPLSSRRSRRQRPSSPTAPAFRPAPKASKKSQPRRTHSVVAEVAPAVESVAVTTRSKSLSAPNSRCVSPRLAKEGKTRKTSKTDSLDLVLATSQGTVKKKKKRLAKKSVKKK